MPNTGTAQYGDCPIRGQEHYSPNSRSADRLSGPAAGFRPSARRAIGRPRRRSRSATKSAVPTGRPVVSAARSLAKAGSSGAVSSRSANRRHQMALIHDDGSETAVEQMAAPAATGVDEVRPAPVRRAQGLAHARLGRRAGGHGWASGNRPRPRPRPCASARPEYRSRCPGRRLRGRSAHAGSPAPSRGADNRARRCGRGEPCAELSRHRTKWERLACALGE